MKDGKGRYSDIAPARRDAEFNRAIVLARIFGASPHGWVLKGGNALLWRDTKARATRDIDLSVHNQLSRMLTKHYRIFLSETPRIYRLMMW